MGVRGLVWRPPPGGPEPPPGRGPPPRGKGPPEWPPAPPDWDYWVPAHASAAPRPAAPQQPAPRQPVDRVAEQSRRRLVLETWFVQPGSPWQFNINGRP